MSLLLRVQSRVQEPDIVAAPREKPPTVPPPPASRLKFHLGESGEPSQAKFSAQKVEVAFYSALARSRGHQGDKELVQPTRSRRAARADPRTSREWNYSSSERVIYAKAARVCATRAQEDVERSESIAGRMIIIISFFSFFGLKMKFSFAVGAVHVPERTKWAKLTHLVDRR